MADKNIRDYENEIVNSPRERWLDIKNEAREDGYDISIEIEYHSDSATRTYKIKPPPGSNESPIYVSKPVDVPKYDGGEERVPGTVETEMKWDSEQGDNTSFPDSNQDDNLRGEPVPQETETTTSDELSEWDRTEDYERMREENRSTEQPEFPESPGETETPSDIPPEEPQPAEEPPPEEPPSEDKQKKDEKPKDAKDDCGYCVEKPAEDSWISSVPFLGDIYTNAREGLHYLTYGIHEGNIFKILLGVKELVEAGMDVNVLMKQMKKGRKKLLIEALKRLGGTVEAEAIRETVHAIIDQSNLSDEQKEDAKEVADILVDEFLDDFKEIVKLPAGKRLNSVLGNVTPHNRKVHRHPDYPYTTEQKLRLMGIDVKSPSDISTREIPMNFESDLPFAFAGTNM